MSEFFREAFYGTLILLTAFLLFKSLIVLDYVLARIDIQKLRADKIEVFLENKYQGEYSAKTSH